MGEGGHNVGILDNFSSKIKNFHFASDFGLFVNQKS
jgi:hypothetical protein